MEVQIPVAGNRSIKGMVAKGYPGRPKVFDGCQARSCGSPSLVRFPANRPGGHFDALQHDLPAP